MGSVCACTDVKDGDPSSKISANGAMPSHPLPMAAPAPADDPTLNAPNGTTVVMQLPPGMVAGKEPVKPKEDSEEEESEDGMDDEEFERQAAINMERRSSQMRRAGVSAEDMDTSGFKPPVFPKTPAQEARISQTLQKCFLFQTMDLQGRRTITAAFKETPAKAGSRVIEKGATVGPSEPGLFVLDSGILDVFIDDGAPVFTYTELGQYFGELALLYNAPRAATVVARQDSLLWSIDRTTFTVLVKDAAQKAQEQRVACLKAVDLLASLNATELGAICDAVTVRHHTPGEFIIKEGDIGRECFIVQEGKLGASKDGKIVRQYGPSECVGELALLLDAPRAASVVALEESVVLAFGQKEFNKMLKVGPVHAALKARAESYGFNFK